MLNLTFRAKYWISVQREFAGRTPLHMAANQGNLDIVKIIANSIANKNPKDVHGVTPLHLAAGRGHLEVVKYLTKFIRNVDIKTDSFHKFKTPVQIAAQDGQIGKKKIVHNFIAKL